MENPLQKGKGEDRPNVHCTMGQMVFEVHLENEFTSSELLAIRTRKKKKKTKNV
jgi:hypothetical protein